MINLINSKKKSLFKQSTALLVVGALLFTVIAPPFASAQSVTNYKLRPASQMMEEAINPTLEKKVEKMRIGDRPQKGLSPIRSPIRSPNFSSFYSIAQQEFNELRLRTLALFKTLLLYAVNSYYRIKDEISKIYIDSLEFIRQNFPQTPAMIRIRQEDFDRRQPSSSLPHHRTIAESVFRTVGESANQSVANALPTLKELLAPNHPLRPGYRLVTQYLDNIDPSNFDDFLKKCRINSDYKKYKSVFLETQGQILYEPEHAMGDADFGLLRAYLKKSEIKEEDLVRLLIIIEKARRRISFSNSLDTMKIPRYMRPPSPTGIFINPNTHTLDVMIPSKAIDHILLEENIYLLEDYLNGQVWHEFGHIAEANGRIGLLPGKFEVVAPPKILELMGRKSLRIGKTEIIADILTRALSGDKAYINYSAYVIQRDEPVYINNLTSAYKEQNLDQKLSLLINLLNIVTVLRVRLEIAGVDKTLPAMKWLEEMIHELRKVLEISQDDHEALCSYYTQIAQSYRIREEILLSENIQGQSMPSSNNIDQEPHEELWMPEDIPLPAEILNLPADSLESRTYVHSYMQSNSYKSLYSSTSKEEKDLKRKMGVSPYLLEPQVAWASRVLAVKGYHPRSSGFAPLVNPNRQIDLDFKEPLILWHSIDCPQYNFSPQEIQIIKSIPGADCYASRNGVFVSAQGRTLGEIKSIFDEVAKKLPVHRLSIKLKRIPHMLGSKFIIVPLDKSGDEIKNGEGADVEKISESQIIQEAGKLIGVASKIRQERKRSLTLLEHLRDGVSEMILKLYPLPGFSQLINGSMNLIEKMIQSQWTPKIFSRFLRNILSFTTAQYIAGANVDKALHMMKNTQPILSIADILGEATLTQEEASANAQNCMELLERMASAGMEPNISTKVTALTLTELLDSKDESKRKEGFDLAVQNYKKIITKAREVRQKYSLTRTMVWIDKEEYIYRDVANQIVQTVLEELEKEKDPTLKIPRENGTPISDFGVVVQAYFVDSLAEVQELIEWMKKHDLPIAMRLVKGAYHSQEVEYAQENGILIPVWEGQWKTDENYLEILRLLMKNHSLIQRIGIASHDVRTLVRGLILAKKLNVAPEHIELQSLFGMTENLKRALQQTTPYRIYAYVPFVFNGEIEKGIRYLLRRFEENSTANSANDNVTLAENGKLFINELIKSKWDGKFNEEEPHQKISTILDQERTNYLKVLPMKFLVIPLLIISLMGRAAYGLENIEIPNAVPLAASSHFVIGKSFSALATSSRTLNTIYDISKNNNMSLLFSKIARINILLGVVQVLVPIPFWISFPLLMSGSILTHYFTNISSAGLRTDPLGSVPNSRDNIQGILKVAAALQTPPEELASILSQTNLSYPHILDPILDFWTKETNDAEIYLVDLNSAKTREDYLLQLRTIRQIEEHKKKNPSKKIGYLFVNKTNLSIQDIKELLGITEILSVLKSPEEAFMELERLYKKESFSLRIVTTNQSSNAWFNLLEPMAKQWNMKMLIPQILDIGKEVTLNLVEGGITSSQMKTWAESLGDEAGVKIKGKNLTIRGISLEPPSKDEKQKMEILFKHQA